MVGVRTSYSVEANRRSITGSHYAPVKNIECSEATKLSNVKQFADQRVLTYQREENDFQSGNKLIEPGMNKK